MAEEDLPVDEQATPERDADGTIPEERWIPMIPFDVSVWGDNDPRYETGGLFTPAERRARILASAKAQGLDPPSKEDVDRLVQLE